MPYRGPRTAASRGWAPGGNYGYDTGGPLNVRTAARPKPAKPPAVASGTIGPGLVYPPPMPPATPPKALDPTISVGTDFTPNYGDIIRHDPGYIASQHAAAAAAKNADAARRQTIRDALVRYGGMPTGFKDIYGDIDQATQDLAAGNQQSTLAGLMRDYGQGQHTMQGQLAARGMLQSGELNYGQNQLDMGLAQNRYNAANALGSTYTGALGTYAGALDQNAQNLASAAAQAEATQSTLPQNQPRQKKTAKYDFDESMKRGGAPVYKDDYGNYYDASGNPI